MTCEYEEFSKISLDTKSPTLFYVIPSELQSKPTNDTTNTKQLQQEQFVTVINPSSVQTKTNLDQQTKTSKCCLII